MALYAADGSINVTVVDGTAITGLYAADGSWNVVVSDGIDHAGVYHPCGAYWVTVLEDGPEGIYATDGSLYVQESPYTYTGGLRVTVVSGNLGLSLPAPFLGAVFDGDSLTANGGEAGQTQVTWPDWFAVITGKPITNVATAGDTSDDIIADYAAQAAPEYNASNRNYYIILIGANDGGLTAAELWTKLTTICNAARATGFKVVICTHAPRSGGIGAALITHCAAIRANWATIADWMIDLEDPVMFTTDVQYIYDGLHFTAAGHVRMAERAASELLLPYVATDATPSAFTFTDASADTSAISTSAEVEMAGLTALAAFTVTGGTLVINGTDEGSSGFVHPYDRVAARGTASATPDATVDVVVTIGGVSDTYTITATAPGSTINWDNPVVTGSGTYSLGDSVFTGSADFKIKSTDTAVTGKKLVAATVANGVYLNFGIYGGTIPGALWYSTTSVIWMQSQYIYYNGTQPTDMPNGHVSGGGTMGLVIDQTAKLMWFTKNGTDFYGATSSGVLTKAQVEAGTSGYDITPIVDAGTVYVGAEAVFGSGAGDVITLLTDWPWASISGYTYLGAP